MTTSLRRMSRYSSADPHRLAVPGRYSHFRARRTILMSGGCESERGQSLSPEILRAGSGMETESAAWPDARSKGTTPHILHGVPIRSRLPSGSRTSMSRPHGMSSISATPSICATASISGTYR